MLTVDLAIAFLSIPRFPQMPPRLVEAATQDAKDIAKHSMPSWWGPIVDPTGGHLDTISSITRGQLITDPNIGPVGATLAARWGYAWARPVH